MTTKSTSADVTDAPGGQDLMLAAAMKELRNSSRRYATEFYGHFLNEHQIDSARAEVAKMDTAAARLYEAWRASRGALPTSAEVGQVVDPPTLWSQIARKKPAKDSEKARIRARRFTRLVRLNERIRGTSEAVTESLPVLRDQILYARHFERNCMRLYGEAEQEQVERLRDAEDMRLSLEQTLGNIHGDVDSLRAQTQSLTLYAQMHLAIQVQLLTGIILIVTVAGVVAAFLR
jgi:hypothetical protein